MLFVVLSPAPCFVLFFIGLPALRGTYFVREYFSLRLKECFPCVCVFYTYLVGRPSLRVTLQE